MKSWNFGASFLTNRRAKKSENNAILEYFWHSIEDCNRVTGGKFLSLILSARNWLRRQKNCINSEIYGNHAVTLRRLHWGILDQTCC